MNNIDTSTDAIVAEMFAKAKKAWELGDKRASVILINQVLKHDRSHRGAWELLYDQYGSGKSFAEFQQEFVLKYYPAEQRSIQAPSAASSGQARILAEGTHQQWKLFLMFYQEHKGTLYLLCGSVFILLCLLSVLLLKPLLDKKDGTVPNQSEQASQTQTIRDPLGKNNSLDPTQLVKTAQTQTVADQSGENYNSDPNFPQGLTAGIWSFMTGPDTAIFAFGRDNKGFISIAPVTYQKTSTNALDFCFLTLKDDQEKTACFTLTVSKIINPENVEVLFSSKYSDPEKYTLQKRFEDTSYGDLKIDVIGTWAYGAYLDEALSSTQNEMVFDESQHVTDSRRGSASYTIVDDTLTMFEEVYIVRNFGDLMILAVENSEKIPRAYFLVRK